MERREPVFNEELALFLLEVCGLTYEQFKQKGVFTVPQGFQLVAQFKARSLGTMETFGFVLKSEDMVVTAFRGTQTNPEWVMDAEVYQTEYLYVPKAGLVHHGFLSIYESCREHIFKAYASIPKHKVLCITGHSLGAAIATLHAIDAGSNMPFANTVMYNFASPRVGNKRFSRKYNKTVPDSIRFVNTCDVVTKLPPIVWYGPITKQVWFYSHVESPIDFSLPTGTESGNHSLETYKQGIESLV